MLACTGSQEPTMHISSHLNPQWLHIGSLKLTMVGVFTLQNWQFCTCSYGWSSSSSPPLPPSLLLILFPFLLFLFLPLLPPTPPPPSSSFVFFFGNPVDNNLLAHHLVQPLWDNLWQFLIKQNIYLFSDLAIPHTKKRHLQEYL